MATRQQTDSRKRPSSEENRRPVYKASGLERWINILLCRGDLADESFESPPVSFVGLFRFGSGGDKLLVAAGILLGILSGVGHPFSVYIGGRMANVLITYGKDHDKEKLWHNGYLLLATDLLVGVFVASLTLIQYFCLRLACRNITTTIRLRFIQAVLRQDAAWFDGQKCGAINSQLNDGIQTISDGIGDKIGLLARGFSMFISTMVISFLVNWKISLVMIGTGPACCITMSFMARMISGATKKQLNSYESSGAILQEAIMNVKTVQSCNGQAQIVQRFSDILKSGRIHGILVYVWNGLFDGIFFFLLYLFYAFGVYYGGLKYFEGEVDAGDVFIIVNSITMGGYFLGLISPHIMATIKARVSAATIYEKIDRVPDIDCTSSAGKSIKNPRGLIRFKEVSFAYPNAPSELVLDKISWDAQPGETVALVGHSGCGKSTSIDLITRMYECTEGQVSIDGEDVKHLNIRQLRDIIGVVQQEPVLFHGTIFENIGLGDPSITLEDVRRACKLANADDFVMKLENNYDTFIGAGEGFQLSGGQKQRIAIARSIVKNPPILLLDEATSALDAESEVLVQTALRDASRGRTTIVIAHRLSTLRDVQKIVVLNKGRVAEAGSHSDLVSKDGLYASLVRAQQFQAHDVEQEESHDDVTSLRRFEIHSSSSTRYDVRSFSSFDSTMTRSSIHDHTRMEYKIADIQTEGGFSRFFSDGLLRLYRSCQGHYWKLTAGTICSLLRGLELPLYAFLMSMAFVLFENVMNQTYEVYKERLSWVAVACLVIGIYSALTIFGSVSFYGWLTEEVVDALKIRALRNVLKQGAEYFDHPETSNAKLLQRISTDTTTLKAALDIRLYHQVSNAFCCIVEIAVAFSFCWQVALAGLGAYCLLFTILGLLAKQLRWNIQKIAETDNSADYSVEIIEHTRTIQLLTKENHFLNHFNEKLRSFWKFQRKVFFYDAIMFSLTQSFFFFSDCACYSLGLYLIYHDLKGSNEVFVASQTLATLSWALLFVSTSFNEILHAIPSIDSVLDIVTAPSCIEDHEIDGTEPDVTGDLSVEKIIFAYPTRPQANIVNGLVLKARREETIALVGPSGGGKSTIIQLLERFYEPRSGQITVDHCPIHRFKLSYLRKQIALVGQEPVLFSGTIHQNISLGVENVTHEEVQKAAIMANAHDFIIKLPQGYDTEIGEKGSKQRIAIARALVRNPKILLLDEATSALDAESERAVQQGLDSAGSGRTCLIIAHRLASIQHANKIYFISNGRVVESGTHEELMAEDSLYSKMIKKQDLRS